MAFFVLKGKHFWRRQEARKDMFNMFREKIHCEECFVRFEQRVSLFLFSMEPELLGGPSLCRMVKSAVVALQPSPLWFMFL